MIMRYFLLISLCSIAMLSSGSVASRNVFQPPAINSCSKYREQLQQQLAKWQYKGVVEKDKTFHALLYQTNMNKWYTLNLNQFLDTTLWSVNVISATKIVVILKESQFCYLSLQQELILQ